MRSTSYKLARAYVIIFVMYEPLQLRSVGRKFSMQEKYFFSASEINFSCVANKFSMHKKFVSAASEGRRPCSRRLDPTHTRPNSTATEALSDIGCRNGCSNGQSHITPIIFQNNLLLLHGSRSKRQQSTHQAVASLLYKKSILSPYDRPADSCQDTRCRQDRGGGRRFRLAQEARGKPRGLVPVS